MPDLPESRHRGYGAELLEQVLAYELRAKTDLVVGPDTVRYTVDLPLTDRVVVRDRGKLPDGT